MLTIPRLEQPTRGGPPAWGLDEVLTTPCLEQPTRGGPPAWGLDEVVTTPHRKNVSSYEPFTKKASDLD
jgi:hypothetical protein